MSKLRRVDIKHRQAIIDKIKEFTLLLKDALPVSEVYLYGSFATGEIHEGSDIDLLIKGDFKDRPFDRIGKVLDLTDLPIEPIVYTDEEFERLKGEQNPFIIEALKTAIKL